MLAANGAEAVEVATKALEDATKPDLIMMDVRMPKMTGYEACRQIKLIDDFKETPVFSFRQRGRTKKFRPGWMRARRRISSSHFRLTI